MKYETAKKLKDAGFPHIHTLHGGNDGYDEYCEDEEFLNGEHICIPKLSELIEACNPTTADEFYLNINNDEWRAFYRYYGYFEHNKKYEKEDGMYEVDQECFGQTYEEAVAKLWLELNKKQ